MSTARKSLWERFDDARGEASNGDPTNSALTVAAWDWFAERLADADVLAAFKAAWHEADARGETGSRVEAGLRAVALEVRKP